MLIAAKARGGSMRAIELLMRRQAAAVRTGAPEASRTGKPEASANALAEVIALGGRGASDLERCAAAGDAPVAIAARTGRLPRRAALVS